MAETFRDGWLQTVEGAKVLDDVGVVTQRTTGDHALSGPSVSSSSDV